MKYQLTTRAYCCLKLALGDGFTPETVSKKSYAELLRLPNCGRATAREIVGWLMEGGLAPADIHASVQQPDCKDRPDRGIITVDWKTCEIKVV